MEVLCQAGEQNAKEAAAATGGLTAEAEIHEVQH
jgi:hypothetical protein